MKKLKLGGFTLVELIVVITILAVLATVAFISFQGYSLNSRDSVRLADMSNIAKGLNVQISQGKNLTKPDDFIEITLSGSLVNYQGYAGVTLLGDIGVHGGGTDPLDNDYYTYTANKALNKFQLLGFLEGEENITLANTTFADNSDKYPKLLGSDLGTLVDSVSSTPIQETETDLEIESDQTDYNILINNETQITAQGEQLKTIFEHLSETATYSSCKEILDKNPDTLDVNGEYILSINDALVSVYCDMTLNGGGRTQLNNDVATSTIAFDSQNQITANNIANGCSVYDPNFVISDIHVPDYTNLLFDLEKDTTILQCSKIGKINGSYVNPSESYYLDEGEYKAYANACSWYSEGSSNQWDKGHNTMLDETANKEWRFFYNYASSIIDFGYYTSCSYPTDTGKYSTTFYVR